MKSIFLPIRLFFVLFCLVLLSDATAQSLAQSTTAPSLPEKGVPMAVNALPIATNTYYNKGKITSSGRVIANTEVTFKSAYAIELKPGFVVEEGSFFEAIIGDNNPITATNLKRNDLTNPVQQSFTHRLFPNPVSESFTLEINAEKEGNAEIVVFNALGSVEAMKPYTINKGIQQFSIDCNDWSSGLYYVRIKMNDTIKTERVVVHNH